MPASDRKRRLLENIARLRRAQRRLPGDRDLAAVRGELERELGDTVSRRLAARFLGVSHSALNRWIERGDLPLVYNVEGHHEVPVPALIALHERLVAERQPRARRGHHLERVMLEARERAEALSARDLAAGAENADDAHGRADRRSLGYHRRVAEILDEAMIDEALYRVRRWREEGKLAGRYAEEWERVLAQPLVDVRASISEETQRGRDLRQNSPFAGMLSEPERRRILAAIG